MGIISGGQIIEGAIPRNAVKVTQIGGGAAGDHTVTGIKTSDVLVAVLHHDYRDSNETGDVITDEFSISAANTINNADGTATSDGFLFVVYLSVS